MKFLITEEQNNKLTRKVKMMIEKLGLQESIKILGDNTNIIKYAYESNPLEFMDNFKDLEIETNPDFPYHISYVKNGKVVMIQDNKYEEFYFDYDEVWSFFVNVLDMEFEESEDILSEWLEDTLKLKGYDLKKLF